MSANSEILNLTLNQLKQKIIEGEILPSEIVELYLKRIRNYDEKLKAFILVDQDGAFKKAQELDEKVKNKKILGKLAGCVIAIKDNINISGYPTTCASRILKGYIAPYDATVIERLKSEDAIIVGKTNMDEFAMGSSTENSAFFITRNPWNTECVPGGSSGGSAVAVASGFSHVALGSDTGGSIRQPAAFCGVVGVKPTYGAVSRYGLVAFASSLDQIGPFSRNVDDAAVLMEVISGDDPKDSTTVDRYLDGLPLSSDYTPKGLKVGLPTEYFQEGVSSEIISAIEELKEALISAGVEFKDVSLPNSRFGVATYYIIAPSEASSNLARFDGVKYGFSSEAASLIAMYKETREDGFGPEVKRRIMLGTYALSSGYYDAYYLTAQKVRALITNDFNNVFKEVDFIISPTTPTTAFKIGEKISDPLSMYLSDVFTISANLAGIPAVSIPIGFNKDSLPIGLQIMASHFADGKMLSFARFVENLVEFKSRIPL